MAPDVYGQTPLSLWQKGPLYRLGLATGWFGPDGLDAGRRAIALALVGWVPFVALGLAEALATGRWDPRLSSLIVHDRWLVALPLLFAAERIVDDRVRFTTSYLRESRIVPQSLDPDLARIEERATAACDAWLPEAALLALAVVLSAFNVHADGPSGVYYDVVSLSLYRFLALRWAQRWLLWGQILYRVSRIDLSIVALHPDRAGGLAVLVQPSRAFLLVILAAGSMVAAEVGQRMEAGVPFDAQLGEIATYVGLSVGLAAAPMLWFATVLTRAKRRGLHHYGVFAGQYVDAFETKWLGGQEGRNALGSGDIQSLSDLGGSYAFVHDMRWFPFTARFLAETAIVAAMPILPLYLASLSVAEILGGLVQLVF